MMPVDSLARTLEFIRAGQNRDGGWGYRPGGASYVEPTAVCALALIPGGDIIATGRGLAFLKTCQQESGAIGIAPGDGEGSWMAYAALLAYHALGATAEERRLITWILAFKDASRRIAPAELKAIEKTYRYDASIPGWPWTAGTTAWVEPTALFLIALARAGVPLTNDRILSGVKLILDRRVPSGGWNFGNPYNRSYELEATLLSTSLALAALAAVSSPESQGAVGSGLRSLRRFLASEASTVSLSWALIALRSYPSGREAVPDIAKRLLTLRAADGSFRRNFFESALAFLALEHPGLIIPPSGTAKGNKAP